MWSVSPIRRLVVLAVLIPGLALPVHGQTRTPGRQVHISDQASCPTCRLELRHIATLAIDSEAGLLDERPWAVQRIGREYALTSAGTALMLFDSAGSLLKVGRRGKGPGEYTSPLQLLKPRRGDTLFVIDPVNGRLSVLGAQGEYLNDVVFPPTRAFDAALLASGKIVLNAMVRDREHIGFPLHLVGRNGAIERSFGATSDFRYDAPPLWRRRLARGDGSRVWAAQELKYVLEEWDAERGTEVTVLTRNSRLFPKDQAPQSATPTQPPPTFVSDVAVDESGRLWILVTVPDSDWKSGLGAEQRTPSGQSYYPPADFDRLHDSVIEVIDPRAGRLVFTTRVPQYLLFLLGDGLVAGYRNRDDGAAIDIYDTRVVHP